MDVKEKLVELIGQVQDCGCDVSDVVEMNHVENAALADHLIANGVTVQEWISVEDRLPERGGFYITYQGGYTYSKIQVLRWNSVDEEWRGAQVGAIMAGVTHWMPLPEPPKEG